MRGALLYSTGDTRGEGVGLRGCQAQTWGLGAEGVPPAGSPSAGGSVPSKPAGSQLETMQPPTQVGARLRQENMGAPGQHQVAKTLGPGRGAQACSVGLGPQAWGWAGVLGTPAGSPRRGPASSTLGTEAGH